MQKWIKTIFVLASVCFLGKIRAQELVLQTVMCDTSTLHVSDMAFGNDGTSYVLKYNRYSDSSISEASTITKYDQAFHTVWSVRYGGLQGGDQYHDIIWLAPDRLLITGLTGNSDGDLAGIGNPNTAGDILALIIDTNGRLLHINTWGYGNNSTPREAHVTSDGKVFITCNAGGNYGDFAANIYPFNSAPALIHADSQLNKKWVFMFLGDQPNSFIGINNQFDVINDKAVWSVLNEDDGYPGSIWIPSVDTGDYNNCHIFIVDTNKNFSKIVVGGEDFDNIGYIQKKSDTSAWILSSSTSKGGLLTMQDIVPPHVKGTDDVGWMLTTLNFKDTSVGWRQSYGTYGGKLSHGPGTSGQGYIYTNRLRVQDSLIWIASSVRGSDNGYIGSGYAANGLVNYRELWMNVYTTSGRLLARKRFSTGCDYGLANSRISPNGDFYLLGGFDCPIDSNRSWNRSAVCNDYGTKYDVGSIHKLSIWPSSTNKPTNTIASWYLYPNPTQGNVHIMLEGFIPQTPILIQVHAADGKKVLSQKFNGADFQCSTQNWAKGIYTVTLISGGSKSSKQLEVR
jgi:Secretion system C-terminal sorting domain